MNPISMNRGYRRMFWAAFFILIGGNLANETYPWFPGIIGLCICISGTNLIYKETGSARFKQAWLFSIAGIILWVPASFQSSEFETLIWNMRFLIYFLGAVITMQIFANVLVGAGELLGGGLRQYFSRCAAVFAGILTITTIAMMFSDVMGGIAADLMDWVFDVLLLLQFLAALWIMNLMASLRRKYPLTLE